MLNISSSKESIILFFLLGFCLNLFGQSDLKEKYKDHEMAFEVFHSTYEFFWDDQSQSLKIRHSEKVDLIPLKTSIRYVWPIFYNDQTQLTKFEIRKGTGRKKKFEKFCGHQGQSGIFHSDSKLCTYSFITETALEPISLTSERVYLNPRYFTKVILPHVLPGKKRIVKIIWPDWVEVELKKFYLEESGISITSINTEGFKGKKIEWDWPDHLPNDKNAPSASHFAPHILPITKAYIDPNSGERKILLENTDNLYAWYKELVRGVENSTVSLEEIVSNLTENKADNDKIKSIYYWVQDNIKYIAFENGIMGFQPDNAQDVFYKRYGDCKGMANLLKSMLKMAGFDARLTWLGTNHIPYTYAIPSLAVDNHMICTVIQEEKIVLLDATVKFNELDYSPGHIQGKQIMIENGESYLIETVPIENGKTNYEKTTFDLTIENEALNVDGLVELDGDAKQLFLYVHDAVDQKNEDKFAREFVSKNADRDDFKVKILKKNRDSVVQLHVNNTTAKNVNVYDNEMYVQMEMREDLGDMMIKKTRKIPFDFGNRRYIQSSYSLKIPEKYSVNDVPESMIESFGDFRFELTYRVEDGRIVYTKNIKIENQILTPDHFDQWNSVIKKLNAFYKNPIVLTYAQ